MPNLQEICIEHYRAENQARVDQNRKQEAEARERYWKTFRSILKTNIGISESEIPLAPPAEGPLEFCFDGIRFRFIGNGHYYGGAMYMVFVRTCGHEELRGHISSIYDVGNFLENPGLDGKCHDCAENEPYKLVPAHIKLTVEDILIDAIRDFVRTEVDRAIDR